MQSIRVTITVPTTRITATMANTTTPMRKVKVGMPRIVSYTEDEYVVALRVGWRGGFVEPPGDGGLAVEGAGVVVGVPEPP